MQRLKGKTGKRHCGTTDHRTMVLVVSRCFPVAPPSRGPVVQWSSSPVSPWSRCPFSASAFLPFSIFPPLRLPLGVSVSLWLIADPCPPWSIVREMPVRGIFYFIPLPNIPLPAKSLPFQGCSGSAALRVLRAFALIRSFYQTNPYHIPQKPFNCSVFRNFQAPLRMQTNPSFSFPVSGSASRPSAFHFPNLRISLQIQPNPA